MFNNETRLKLRKNNGIKSGEKRRASFFREKDTRNLGEEEKKESDAARDWPKGEPGYETSVENLEKGKDRKG